jgi:predicted deacylase
MGPDPLRICNTDIAPGSSVTIDLPLPNLYTHASMYMPVRVLCGRQTGPTLLVSAALHGDEINGVEIIRRLLAMPLLRRLHGTLIAVPVVNVFGFVAHSRYLPDRRDLNRSFPGSEKGSLTARLAHLFVTELFSKASHGIDLHTGAIHRANLPQIRASLNIPEVQAMAEAFGAPVILDSGSRLIDGSLRKIAVERGIPYIVYEAGEALRFDELAIRAGVQGVISVMRSLQMLGTGKARKTVMTPVLANRSGWLRAPQSGMVRAVKTLGAHVEKDELVAWISDPLGDQDMPLTAEFSGIIVGCSNLPLVSEGDALFNVAGVAEPGSVKEDLESFHEELADMSELAADPETLDGTTASEPDLRPQTVPERATQI